MKKIAIISVADIRHMTCASFFTNYFVSKKNVDLDIICMDRYSDNLKSTYSYNMLRYNHQLKENANKIYKLKIFLKFRKFAINLLKERKYDYIVIWGENTGILLGSYLLRKYSSRYCMNIRDVDNRVSNFLIKPIINKSAFSTLPTFAKIKGISNNKKILPLLNNDRTILDRCQCRGKFKTKSSVLRITYMGLITPYLENFKRFIQAFANDSRYELAYYGRGANEELKQFVEDEKINNVIIGGAFPVEKTVEYLNETDIINSYYGTNIFNLKIGIGVKESYGPQLKIPTISDANTLWENLSMQYGFGIGVKDVNRFPDELYEWYHNLDFEIFCDGCKSYCEYVKNTNEKIVCLLNELMNKNI